MPTKIYRIKWMTFGLMLAQSSLPTSKNKEIESANPEINAFKLQHVHISQITDTAPFPPHRHFNSYHYSIAGSVKLWTWLRTIEFEWIEKYPKSVRWKGSSFVEKGLVVIWRHLSHFWLFWFLNAGNEEDCSIIQKSLMLR